MTNIADAINALTANSDHLTYATRDLLIDLDEPIEELLRDIPTYLRAHYTPQLELLRSMIELLDPHDASLMRLDHSLCPMHSCDYAICFDDADPECAAIRELFPSHDT